MREIPSIRLRMLEHAASIAAERVLACAGMASRGDEVERRAYCIAAAAWLLEREDATEPELRAALERRATINRQHETEAG